MSQTFLSRYFSCYNSSTLLVKTIFNMEFFEKYNLKVSKVLKITGLVVLAIVVIVFAFRLIGSSFNPLFQKLGISNISSQGVASYDYAGDYKTSEGYGVSQTGLSTRNVTTPSFATVNNGTTGDNAEDFEVTEYNASVETRELSKTCAIVIDLKAQKDVIFENSSEYTHGCNYVFKVKHDKVGDVLAVIKNLKPKELSENTYTIKQLVDDYTGRIEILNKKLSSIDDTLKKAITAYDGVTLLATKVQDVESLAKIIDSKINLIERLTQERININSELERIVRSKATQLDRLEYTYFRVNVYENKFIDGGSLGDSWKATVKGFVQDVNQIAQDITINLAVFLLFILKYVVYALILLVIAKYGWQFVKYIWKK